MKKLKAFIIILLVLFGQIGLSYSIISRLLAPKTSTWKAEEDKEEKEEKKATEDIGEIYLFKDVVVNPANTGGRRYLVVSMGFELDTKKLGGEIERKEPQIRDAVITLLSQKGISYLVDIQQREFLRGEIVDAVNRHLSQGQVIKVYFVKYVLQ